MRLTNENKALVITILLSSTVVLMAFNFHLIQKGKLISETYYEILPDDESIEELEELEDILESLDKVLATNKAYNSTKNYDDFQDEEFESTLDKIRNRDSRLDALDNQTNDATSNKDNSQTEELESFDEINDIIAKRSEEKRADSNSDDGANKNSSISYSLVNRTATYLPPPIYLCERGGKIVVNITVDDNGTVTEASFNSSSTTDNGCLVDSAITYAKASKFDAASNPQQIGTITFIFRGKS